jgi:predicted porin
MSSLKSFIAANRVAVRTGLCCCAAALALGASSAVAAETDAPAQGPPAPAKPKPADSSLTFHGITLYGVVDLGVAYLNHGAPLSATYSPGLPFLVQKYSSRPIFSMEPNGLSQSKLGLSGVEPIGAGVSVVFKLETGFQPTSGQLNDGPASLIINNGRPLSQDKTASDSARAGQWYNGAAYAGLSSKSFGTLTYGWQTSLMADDLVKYDPQAQAYAFSPIAFSGVAGGAGDTEDTRLDRSLKYVVGHGPVRLALLHQFGRDHAVPGGSDAVDLGFDYRGLSVDAIWDKVNGAAAASSLSAAQNLVHPGTLAATISDNTTWSVQAKYALKKLRLYGGWEHIEYANPSQPLPAGTGTLGGYVLSYVNNAAFNNHKILQISWIGARWAVTPKLEVAGAYYRYDQNSYKGNGCSDTSAASCSGNLYEISASATYKLVKHLDLYGGVVTSRVEGGLASGYLKAASAGPVAGIRFSF